jgi:hypothetical protein
MALQSVWYYSNLPEDIVNIIEKDLTENFDDSMGDSRLHGDALNKEKRNSQNTWIPTTYGTMYREQIVRTFCMI